MFFVPGFRWKNHITGDLTNWAHIMELISENYKMVITDRAQEDIDEYIDTIIYTYDAPITAKKHYDGLYEILGTIKKYPEINPIRNNLFLFQYGSNVRRANYKKIRL